MKILYKAFGGMMVAMVTMFAVTSIVRAALIPTMTLALMNNNTQVQVTILGADANAPVTLYYPVNSNYSSLNIGTTNATGYLSYTMSPSTYNVTAGGASYALVNGAQSQTQTWPAYSASSASTGSASLVLSSNNVTVGIGQSQTVSVNSSNNTAVGTVSVSSNTNPSVATASVSGSQITIQGNMVGSTIMTVCASSVGCVSMYVTVQQTAAQTTSQNQTTASSIVTINPSTITLRVGETQTAYLSGPGSYYISAHSNGGLVSNSLSGSALTIKGLIVGTDIMSVCGASGNTTSCSSLTVNILQSTSNSTTGSTQTITFSPSQVSLVVGGSQNVTVTGSGLGSYYVSATSDSNIASGNMSGNTLSIYANATGGSNITVCQLGGVCGNVYAFVMSSNGSVSQNQNATQISTVAPVMSSFSVSSNNVGGGFMSSGAALTLTFSLSQPVSSKSLMVGSQVVGLNGSGTGPYAGIYTLTGNEKSPLPVSVIFSDASGRSGHANFTIGSSVAVSTPTTSSGATFVSYLQVGSLSAEVTALQTRLTALGLYSGPITGKFGAQTEAAVKKYQAKHKINQLGAVGPATRALLNQGI